ncbi:PH domain-containing protein, partial [Halomonas sp. AOP42-D1-22]|uniref:PH domain-containing protein n=1 Tax=Halomonas sp. AOP42-D1-22 TaxID=3457667 RepID=UPI004034EDB5
SGLSTGHPIPIKQRHRGVSMQPSLQTKAESGNYLRRLKPSLALALPSFIAYLALALVVTYALYEFQPEVLLMAGWIGLGARLEASYALVVAALWALCAMKPLWQALVLLTTRYDVSSDMLYYSRGVLNSRRDQIEIARIRDLSTEKPFPLRLLGLGYLQVDSVDTTHPQLVLRGQRDVNELKAWLHMLNVQERQRLGVREFSHGHNSHAANHGD